MPSEMPKTSDEKIFALRGENSGLRLQAGEVAWMEKPKNNSWALILVGMSIAIAGFVLIGNLSQ